MNKAACPSRELLLHYLQGNFDISQLDSLEEHLEQCPRCEDTVAELENSHDTLMRHLPLAASDAAQADLDAPAWMKRLKVGPPTGEHEPQEQPHEAQDESIAKAWAAGLASYELLEVLGKGGMGVVYRGRHRQLGRPVAVKVVRPKLVSAVEAHRRFDREIQILGGLNHPGIVMATDAGRVERAAFLVMELIDGVDLARLVRSAGPLNVGEACEVARQIALALAAAHAAGAVHRDVKPSNVMIDKTGRVKLLDFGLACLTELSSDRGETSLGQLIGTLDYMAPEQADGTPVQASADLYGLGATLFYLLAGRPPHASDRNRSLLSQLKALSCEEPPRLADVRGDVPVELSDLVAKLLARNSADRPASAMEVADGLATWSNPDAKPELAKLIKPGDRADDAEAAARSLVELIAGESREAEDQRASKPTATTAQAPTAGDGNGRRIGRWLLGAAGSAAALLGIILLVKTPEGTLRIESEAENVQIELVDEADKTTTLQIDEGNNATQLRAGKYRIRLAGKHDNLALTPGTIELRRGEERLARITQLPPDAAQVAGAAEKPGDPARGDPFHMPSTSEQKTETTLTGTGEVNIRATNEELTHVDISVVYEDGSPATGAEVTLSLNGDSNRPVVVVGKADARGVAFNRNLPYGKYEMKIKVPAGSVYWTMVPLEQDILLPFGGSFARKIVAPTPQPSATVNIESGFRSSTLAGLRFGGYSQAGIQNDRSNYAPEFGQPDGQFAGFPQSGDGIVAVAVEMGMNMKRKTKQSDGQIIEWWVTRPPGHNSLWLTDNGIFRIELDETRWQGHVTMNLPESNYFKNLRKGGTVEYFDFKESQLVDNPLSLEFPPGELQLFVLNIWGKPTDAVVQALGLKPDNGNEIWLPARIQPESGWPNRAIDLTGWNRNQYGSLAQAFSLQPGETQTIRISSPESPAAEGVANKPGTGELNLVPTTGVLDIQETNQVINQETTTEELTRAAVSVIYQDGNPATGAEVILTMQGNPQRPVVAKGKADSRGLALDRSLPYGKYVMTIKVAAGQSYWSATLRNVLLEFGGSYEQMIVAPTPEKQATVAVRSDFNRTTLEGLRFGSYVIPSGGSGYGIAFSPEPDQQDERFAHFPLQGSGIVDVALLMKMKVTRNIKQADDTTLDWYWIQRQQGDSREQLLVSDKNVAELGSDTGGRMVFGFKERKYFTSEDENHGVQYYTFPDRKSVHNPLTLEFPPGTLQCEINSFWGQATNEVVQALGLEPQEGSKVWLQANMNAESAWVPRAIDLTDWSRGQSIQNLAHLSVELKPGETQVIRVASPE